MAKGNGKDLLEVAAMLKQKLEIKGAVNIVEDISFETGKQGFKPGKKINGVLFRADNQELGISYIAILK